MKRSVLLVLPLLTLALGFVAGVGFGVVVLGGRGDADTPQSPAQTPRRAASESGAESGDAGGGAARKRAPSGEDQAVQNALRAAGDTAVRGTGSIRGAVLDAAGDGVADVRVSASADWDGYLEAHPELTDEGGTLEAELRALVRRRRFEEATRVEARTASDGTYVIEHLADAQYELYASCDGWAITAAHESAGRPGDVVDFVATRLTLVELVPHTSDGAPLTDVEVSVHDLGDNSVENSPWTPDDPSLELSPGAYEITLTAGAQDEYRSEPLRVDVSEATTQRLDVPLVARSGVRGTVHFAGDARPASVGILAVRTSALPDLDPRRLFGADDATWVQDPWEFALLDLGQGPHLVAAVLRNGTVLDSAVVEVGTGITLHDFVAAGDVRDFVRVRVTGADGAAVTEGCDFVVSYRGDGVWFQGNVSAERDEDGSWRVPAIAPGGERSGVNGWSQSGGVVAGRIPSSLEYTVAVHSSALGRATLAYDPARDRELEVRFGLPAFVNLTIDGYAQSRLFGKVRAVLRAHATDTSFGSRSDDDTEAKPNARGEARAGPVAPGDYDVVVQALTPQNGWRDVVTRTTALASGELALAISLPDLYDLTVECEGEALDLDLHNEAAHGEAMQFLDEGVREGALTHFTALPAGRYVVRAWGDGSPGEMHVTIPSPGRVLFRPRPYDALRVQSVPDALRDLLAVGDVVVAIGGREYQGDRQLRAAIALAQSGERVTFGVLRQGRVSEVVVPTESLDPDGFAPITR